MLWRRQGKGEEERLGAARRAKRAWLLLAYLLACVVLAACKSLTLLRDQLRWSVLMARSMVCRFHDEIGWGKGLATTC